MSWAKAMIDFFHLSAISAWIGAIIFLTIILFPIFKKLSVGESSMIVTSIFRIFRILSIVCLIIIIISGIILTLQQEAGKVTLLGMYGIIFVIKHVLTLVIMALILVSIFYLFPKVKTFCDNIKSQNAVCPYQNQVITVMVICSILGIIVLLLTSIMQLF